MGYTYTTAQGDMWDSIAYEQLGTENHMGTLIENNPDLVDFVVFPAGIEVEIPDVDTTQSDLPSWRDGLDDQDDDLTEFDEEDDEDGDEET